MLKIDSIYFGPNEFNPMLPNKVKEFAATSTQYTLHFNNLLKTVGNPEGITKTHDNNNVANIFLKTLDMYLVFFFMKPSDSWLLCNICRCDYIFFWSNAGRYI